MPKSGVKKETYFEKNTRDIMIRLKKIGIEKRYNNKT